MKNKTTTTPTEQPEAGTAPTPATATNPPDSAVRVKVLKTGLAIGTSTAARGAIVNVTSADAEYFSKRGDVTVLGPV